jgi:bifunctional UDP-N-acetylglucosamine pyrophosphorylase/glucosamine-1-phosphate N-acetyltransferase
MALEILVLAAGQGKRMRSSLPKVLHPLAGRPMLAHVLDAARTLAPRKIIVVHGHGAEQVKAAFPQPDLEWVLQAEQLGTAHAVMQAMPRVGADADVLILYGDMPVVRAETLRRLLDAGREGLALLTADIPNHPSFGRVVRDGERIARIVEVRDASAAERRLAEVNVGFYALGAKRLAGWLKRIDNRNAQKEYYLTDLIQLAVADGVPVAGVKVADAWEAGGVNSKLDLARLERQYQENVAHELLEKGVTIVDPARIDVRGTLECGSDVAIDVNCVFEGAVRLGDGVRVGPNCILKNVTIAQNCEVLAFCHLEDSQIGERCRIGPYARLRPGSRLAEDVHIGNFVEVKASRLGAGSKANHLTYLGDSEIGARVNVGAGTITCNYDGAAKHRTVIEDDCFIGSDATLVAPVRIARGSYIGAGSTINKDTPAGQLTVARAKQQSIPGWKPPRKKA